LKNTTNHLTRYPSGDPAALPEEKVGAGVSAYCSYHCLINGNTDLSVIYFHSGRVAVVTPKGEMTFVVVTLVITV